MGRSYMHELFTNVLISSFSLLALATFFCVLGLFGPAYLAFE